MWYLFGCLNTRLIWENCYFLFLAHLGPPKKSKPKMTKLPGNGKFRQLLKVGPLLSSTESKLDFLGP